MSIYFYNGRALHAFGRDFWILTPRDRPLFSERNGYTVPVLRFMGYRLFVRKRA